MCVCMLGKGGCRRRRNKDEIFEDIGSLLDFDEVFCGSEVCLVSKLTKKLSEEPKSFHVQLDCYCSNLSRYSCFEC